MKQDSLSILFFALKGRLLKNGEAPIILRVTLNGREDQMRVLRSVPMHLWNRAKGRSTGKDASSKELNNYLNGLQIRLLAIHKELSEREAHITPSLLLSKLFAKDEKHLLVASFKKHIDECTKLIGIDYEAVTINRLIVMIIAPEALPVLLSENTKKRMSPLMSLMENLSASSRFF